MIPMLTPTAEDPGYPAIASSADIWTDTVFIPPVMANNGLDIKRWDTIGLSNAGPFRPDEFSPDIAQLDVGRWSSGADGVKCDGLRSMYLGQNEDYLIATGFAVFLALYHGGESLVGNLGIIGAQSGAGGGAFTVGGGPAINYNRLDGGGNVTWATPMTAYSGIKMHLLLGMSGGITKAFQNRVSKNANIVPGEATYRFRTIGGRNCAGVGSWTIGFCAVFPIWLNAAQRTEVWDWMDIYYSNV